MRRIEFSGIPGSGKSTLLPWVVRYLKQLGCDVVDRHDLILRSHCFPFNSPSFRRVFRLFPPAWQAKWTRGLNNYFYVNYEYQLRHIASERALLRTIMELIDRRPIPEAHKALLTRWFLKMAGACQQARECLDEHSLFLCDEGYVQKVISLYVSVEEHPPAVQALEQYLARIPDQLDLIHVTADTQTCLRRIVTRRLPKRLSGYREEAIEAYLQKSRQAIDFATQFLSDRGSQVVVVNNSVEPLAVADIEHQLSTLPWAQQGVETRRACNAGTSHSSLLQRSLQKFQTRFSTPS